MTVACLVILFLGLSNAWSIYTPHLKATFPSWSNLACSAGYSILMSMWSVGNIVAGTLARKLSNRLLMAASAVVMALGFFCTGLMLEPSQPGRSLICLYVFFCTISGFCTGVGYSVLLGSVMRRFPDKQGFASGLLLMFYGFGSLILGSLINRMNGLYGLVHTFFLTGAVLLLVQLCALPIVPHARAAERAQKQEQEQAGEEDYTPAQVLRSPSYWLYMVWLIAKTSACTMVSSNAASIAAFYGAPLVMGLVFSLTNGAGRLLFGSAVDLIGLRRTIRLNNVVMFLCGAFMVAGGLAKTLLHAPVLALVLIVVGIFVSGLGFGSSPSISVVYARKKWGGKNFSANYGLVTLSLFVSATTGPMLSGAMQDLASESEPYLMAFVVMLGICILSCVFGTIIVHKESQLDEKRRT